jgi:hypothetical protein
MPDHISRILHRWTDLSVTGGPTDRDLAEPGLTRGQADRLAHLPRMVPARMQAMAAIFGLTPAQLEANRADWIEIAETCAECRHKGECRSTLARGAAVQPAETGFCPNAPHYADLATGMARQAPFRCAHRPPSLAPQAAEAGA